MQNSAKSRKKSQRRSDRPLPRGTVTFLFSDIEGSTRLLARLRDGYADVLGEHHRALRSAFAQHRGHEVHTEGDAFFAAFERATDAIAAAVTAQRTLAAHDWPDGVDLRVRMGVHTGEAEVWDDDYVGLDVHRAARICSAAHGGQVLVSSSTRQIVAAELASDVALRDLGEHHLKDLERPERLFQLLVDDLPADFPSPRSEAPADRAVRALPPAPNRTIGREADVHAIARRIRADGVRLLTLTGPGGVGKTRLAVEAARAIQADFADGARFVSLAALERHEDVAAAIVAALGIVVLSGETAAGAVTRYLAAKRLLLVVDNFEHVLAAAPFIGDVVAACPTLAVVVTSREPLALHAEARYPVETLAAPDAVALFDERAHAHDPAPRLEDGDADAVAEICRRLDGLPLAIELAAARCALLSPPRSPDGSTWCSVRRGRAMRRSASGRSGRRLTGVTTCSTKPRRRASPASRCSVAARPWRRRRRSPAPTSTRSTVWWPRACSCGAGLPRARPGCSCSRPCAPTRATGSRPCNDAKTVRERHHAYFRTVAERHGGQQAQRSANGRAHAAALDAEADNLAAALAWAIEHRDAERALGLVAALAWYWLTCDRYADAVHWADRALGLPGADAEHVLRAQALILKGWSLWPLGRGTEQAKVLAESEAAARRAGDPVVLTRALQLLSTRAASSGRPDLAESYAHEAVEQATRARDEWAIASAWFSWAVASMTIADLRERTVRAAALLAEAGNVVHFAGLLSSAAYGAMCLNSDQDAIEFVERALPATRDLGNPFRLDDARGQPRAGRSTHRRRPDGPRRVPRGARGVPDARHTGISPGRAFWA